MSPKVVHVEHDIDISLEQRAIKTGPALCPQTEGTLPNDVLIDIFVLIAQDHGPVVFPLRKHEAPPQFVLSHVCSRWRTLALRTFKLWNNVCLVNRDDNRVSLPYHEWLLRAGSSSIKLSLRFAGLYRDEGATAGDDDRAARIIQDTVSHFKPQIKMLHIHLTFRQFKTLSSFPDTILPQIEKLELEFDTYDVEETFSSASISFTRLQSVDLNERHYFTSLDSHVLQNISLPWSQLRCLMLYFKARDLIPIFDTLRQIPLLQELHLSVRLDPSHRSAPLERLTFPSLRRITLELFINVEDATKVLRHITCPALIKLDIHRTAGSKETYEIIKQQYNLQGLEELALLNPTIPVSSILKDAPKLHTLWIRGDRIDDEANAGLSNGTLGRYLRDLTITSACDIHRLLGMVEMRKRTVDGLIEKRCNWREMITVLRQVGVYGKDCNERNRGYCTIHGILRTMFLHINLIYLLIA